METAPAILRMFLLPWIVSNLLRKYEEYRKNSERSDRPDEIGSDPNMHTFSPQTVHTGWRAAVVPRQHRIRSKHAHVRVIWRILFGIRRLRNRSYFLPRIHHTKPCFPSHIKPCFPPHIHYLSHFYDIKPCFLPDEPLDEYEIDHKKQSDDEIQSLIDEYWKEWSPGYEHYQHLEENNISPTCKTKSSDGEAENLNQLGSIISTNELNQDYIEFVQNYFPNEDNCSSSTHKHCGILGENMTSSNDVGFMFPLATKLACSDPALKQGMATVSPAVPHVTTSPSLLAPTQPTLMAKETGAQSLQCSTKSTAQDNLGWLLEEERSVAIINPSMDEKLELTTQCIPTTQLATSSLHPEAFSNGEDNMQLDSSESQSLDATNTGGKVVNADESCTAISHPEKKNIIGTRKTKCGTAKDIFSCEDILQLSHLKREEAARRLGVHVSTFKRLCRHYGISRWDHPNISKARLAIESVQGVVGAFISPTTSSHTDVVNVGSSNQNSQGSKPPRPQREKKMSPSCNQPSIGGQDEIAAQMLENNLSAHKGQLQEQNRFHLQRQEAGNVTIKATYGEHIVRVPTFSTSGIVELKKELAKRLELEHGSFNVKYQDEDLDWILIACDDVLDECLKSSISRGNQVVRLLVLDKVVNSDNFGKVEEH